MANLSDRFLTAAVEHDGRRDAVAVEDPLEIRVDGEALAVTMRTPGHDEELALGFLLGEGLIDAEPRRAAPPADLPANAVDVAGPLLRDIARRRFHTTSSCGVCGKGALEEVAVIAGWVGSTSPSAPPGPVVPRALLASLPDRLHQPGFEATGALHATGLFNAQGDLLCVREDVGRHNAMDNLRARRRGQRLHARFARDVNVCGISHRGLTQLALTTALRSAEDAVAQGMCAKGRHWGAEDMGEDERDQRDAGMTWHVCGSTSSRMPDLAEMTAVDVKRRLALLFEERSLAISVGLGDDPAYMADLDDEIAATRAAWTGAAVTEIASLRAQLSGAQRG